MFGTGFNEEYDPQADALYIRFRQKAAVRSTERIDDAMNIDLDENGDIVGLEVLHPEKHRGDVVNWLVLHGYLEAEHAASAAG